MIGYGGDAIVIVAVTADPGSDVVRVGTDTTRPPIRGDHLPGPGDHPLIDRATRRG
jgi:hypothetical protein